MAWNDLATVVGRKSKGTALSLEEYDANNNALNAKQAEKAPYATSGGKPIGFTGKHGFVYPLIRRPIEILAGSAIGFSCSLTSIDEPLDSFAIPAGLLGVNSILQIEPLWTFTNSANNKILKVKVGGVTVYSATRTTSVKEAPLIVLANRNSLASQIQPYDGAYGTAGASAPATHSIDFANNVVVDITGQRADSGDALTLEYYRVLHFVGD
ncbi:hypothetical protein SAMN05216404_106140 [Nitrosospira multiformis]|uniref:Uncharacterized protein n=1 Tax=Nitrosospira multiformis TaxID=1231 RepID=A0A1H8IQ42_9PROT|nr:hypothetical protein [Nitrosospira multiformis]SEN70539.1 hypothetical protein SAMN05216404_106140 [Nitrosospira multiformis]